MDETEPDVEAGHPLAGLYDHVGDLVGEGRGLRDPRHVVNGEPWIPQDGKQHARVAVLKEERSLGPVGFSRKQDLLHLRERTHAIPGVLPLLRCFLIRSGRFLGAGRLNRRSWLGEQSGKQLVRISVDGERDPVR